MKINSCGYNIDDLIKIISYIFNEVCGIKKVRLKDSFFKDFNIFHVINLQIIKVIQYVLDYKLTLDEVDKIDSINDMIILYQNIIERQSILNSYNKDVRIFKQYE